MQTRQFHLNPASDVPEVAYLLIFSQNKPTVRDLYEYTTMGREPSCLIQIDDEFTSTYHARIERRREGFVIKDLRSRNGTFVNGARIHEAILRPGDKIRIGSMEFQFEYNPQLSPITDLPKSKNNAWNQKVATIPGVAESELPVLLLGDSGVGKEVLARLIHSHSPRANGPFVSVNCSALNESLVESELFGHVKGSFTGATCDRKGAFEAARGGTLFLDEIGDLPISLQPKLLRALENKEIRPVGSDKHLTTDVRIVAATHRNIKNQILQNKFRSDLYYRLNVIQFKIPSLKERLEDFEALLFTFAREMRVNFSNEAIRKLKTYSWPGNIRELRNAVSRASALFSNRPVNLDDLRQLIEIDTFQTGIENKAVSSCSKKLSVIKEMEKQTIIETLVACKGNQRRAADSLGMPKSTLHDKVKTYAIDIHKIKRLSRQQQISDAIDMI